MTVKEIVKQSGMNMTSFASYFDIPYHTIQNWSYGVRSCPDYLVKLMLYKLRREGILPDQDGQSPDA